MIGHARGINREFRKNFGKPPLLRAIFGLIPDQG